MTEPKRRIMSDILTDDEKLSIFRECSRVFRSRYPGCPVPLDELVNVAVEHLWTRDLERPLLYVSALRWMELYCKRHVWRPLKRDRNIAHNLRYSDIHNRIADIDTHSPWTEHVSLRDSIVDLSDAWLLLPERDRELLREFFYLGLTARQIAILHNQRAASHVLNKIHKAIGKLRTLLHADNRVSD